MLRRKVGFNVEESEESFAQEEMKSAVITRREIVIRNQLTPVHERGTQTVNDYSISESQTLPENMKMSSLFTGEDFTTSPEISNINIIDTATGTQYKLRISPTSSKVKTPFDFVSCIVSFVE